MKAIILVVSALCAFQVSLAIVCLPNACDSMDCSSVHDEIMNCDGRIDATGGFCGCCPACIKQLNEGESCMTLLGAPSKAECSEGLECHSVSKTCVKSQSVDNVGPCHKEVISKTLSQQAGMMGVHMPECLEDGSYAPVQCREAVCMCVDKSGKQIGSIQAEVGRHNEMNCQCARDKDARKLSMIVFEKQCDELGNYERVQCSRGQCYCVNMVGQKIEGFGTVAEENKEQLGGCLEKVRRSETVGACKEEINMIQQGGTPAMGRHTPQCLQDGSYHPRQCRESVCMCVDSQGKLAGNFVANVGKANQMSCQCARDQADYRKSGMVGQSFACDELGNYQSYRCVGSVCFCIDQNGEQMTSIPSVSIGQLSSLNCKAQPVGACQAERNGLQTRVGAHKPQCLEDGSYHPRQCQEAVCHCVDTQGKDAGFQNSVGVASQMNCQCARDKAEYMKTGMVGKMFNCNSLGNYESIQCVGSFCHCVDQTGVKLEDKEVVPIGSVSQLSCN